MIKTLLILISISFIFTGCDLSNDAKFSPTNTTPTIHNITITTDYNTSTLVVLPKKDIDKDTLTYKITRIPNNGQSVVKDNIISYHPNKNFSGEDNITYEAYDGKNISLMKTITFIVKPVINHIPIINNINATINKNTQFIINLQPFDVDNDTLSYSFNTQPTNGTLTLVDYTLTYTPNNNFIGLETISFHANDGELDSKVKTLKISINSSNTSPIILPINIPVGKEGKPYQHKILASDVDNDVLTYSLEFTDSIGNPITIPAWLSINSNEASFSANPIGLNITSPLFFKIVVTDTEGLTDTAIKQWDIEGYKTFNTVWKTDEFGVSDDLTVSFYVELYGDNLIDWGDGTVIQNLSNGTYSHTYSTIGTYTIRIGGIRLFDAYTNNNNRKLLEVSQWGDSTWSTFKNIFRDAVNIKSTATDSPNIEYVEDMSYAFYKAGFFDPYVNDWKVGNVKNMLGTFWDASSFRHSTSNWDTRNVTNMALMFRNTTFNSDISSWDVSNVTNMSSMFSYSIFNQDISSWDVSNVTNMSNMFSFSPFNKDISPWNVSNVTNMVYLFYQTPFNQDISSWDVSNVTNMQGIFRASFFNKSLNGWDVSNVTNMSYMFYQNYQFNKDVSTLNMSNVKSMLYMLSYATSFNQDISSWDLSSVIDMRFFLNGSTSFSTTNYDLFLNSLSSSGLSNITTKISSSYTLGSSAETARNDLITNYNWSISDNGGI